MNDIPTYLVIENNLIVAVISGVEIIARKTDVLIKDVSEDLIKEINNPLINGISKQFTYVNSKIVAKTLKIEEVVDKAVLLQQKVESLENDIQDIYIYIDILGGGV
ncbi:MAG: hypothetical protein ACRCZK_01740 [Oscillospiraceae bacterium]